MAKKRKKKEATAKVDGLSMVDIRKIRAAIRKVWHWSYPKKLATARATGMDGFAYCEAKDCHRKGVKVPKVFIDHIKAVGDVDAGFIERLFCPSSGLQALCKKCHDKKTRLERKENKELEELGLR